MNEKWVMYLMASINKHFEANIASDVDLLVTLFVEGFNRTVAQNDAENLIEVRCTGPFWTMTSPKTWKVVIVVNCALQTTINDENNYKIWRMFGKVNKAFATPIAIFNYEEGNNAPTQIGCLQLLTNKQDIIDNFLGQVDGTAKRVQGEVTAHFTIDLEDA